LAVEPRLSANGKLFFIGEVREAWPFARGLLTIDRTPGPSFRRPFICIRQEPA